jgi:hypothetical protein
MVLVLWSLTVMIKWWCGDVLCVCLWLMNLAGKFVIPCPISRACPLLWCRQHTPGTLCVSCLLASQAARPPWTLAWSFGWCLASDKLALLMIINSASLFLIAHLHYYYFWSSSFVLLAGIKRRKERKKKKKKRRCSLLGFVVFSFLCNL